MRILLSLAALLAACPLPAFAAESYDACSYEITTLPAVLSTQGTWCLKADRATAITTGAAITIAANNVTLDCNGFKLGGLQAGPLTETSGIYINTRTNTTIRHCNIRGFKNGVETQDAASLAIEDNRFEFNTTFPIWVKGTELGSSVIARNRVSDTESPLVDGQSIAILAEGRTDIIDNLVDGVRPAGASDSMVPTGIYVTGAAGTITGNRVRELVSTGFGTAYGIFVGSASGTGGYVVDRNIVDVNLGEYEAYAIYCATPFQLAVENRLMGDATPFNAACVQSNNHVDVD